MVITLADTDKPQRTIELEGAEPEYVHWRPNGREAGLLSDNQLLVVDTSSNQVTNLSGVLGVERFVGWSDRDEHMAYLVDAETFPASATMLPTGEQVMWAPTERHNLMIAQPDGSAPESRFNLMNISAAEWGNQSARLSFWATYMPTVSLLPPGDPAAVLNINDGKISWYPTDLAEYAHVGHYYLLNEQFAAAADQYSNALRRVQEQDEELRNHLTYWIRLWRGVARMALNEGAAAAGDFDVVSEQAAMTEDDLETAQAQGVKWDEPILRRLIADRDVLSTMISMRQVELAARHAAQIALQDTDARRIQAFCYLALIYKSVGDAEAFTDQVINHLLPATLLSAQIPKPLTWALVTYYLEAVTALDNLQLLSSESQLSFGNALSAQLDAIPSSQTAHRTQLIQSVVTFYRQSGSTAAELALLNEHKQQ